MWGDLGRTVHEPQGGVLLEIYHEARDMEVSPCLLGACLAGQLGGAEVRFVLAGVTACVPTNQPFSNLSGCRPFVVLRDNVLSLHVGACTLTSGPYT